MEPPVGSSTKTPVPFVSDVTSTKTPTKGTGVFVRITWRGSGEYPPVRAKGN